MHLGVQGDEGDRDLTVHTADGATVGDLAAALFGAGGPPDGPLGVDGQVTIDGRVVAPETRISDAPIVAGSLVRSGVGGGAGPASDVITAERPAGQIEFRILSGPGAGLSVILPPGRHVVGTGPGADVVLRAAGVAPRHAVVDVWRDGRARVRSPVSGPARPVTPEATVRIGACLVACVPVPAHRSVGTPPPGRRGTAPFNRPPRPPGDPVPGPVAIPGAPRPPAGRPRLGLAVVAVPVMFGIVMAVAVHPRMALFALLGPLMAVAGLLDDRRRLRRFRRESASEIAEAAHAVGADLDRRRMLETRRRHRTRPSVAALVRCATLGSPSLWERRPGHHDFLRIVLGYGRQRWQPPFDGDVESTPVPVRRSLTLRGELPRGPVSVDLGPGSVIGVIGARLRALDLARGLVCQAAVLHGPADLRISVVTDHPADWDWVKWLPHTLADVASRRRLLAATPDETTMLAATIAATATPPATGWAPSGAGRPAAAGPATLLVVDVAPASTTRTPIRHLLGGRAGPLSGIVIGADRDRLPAVCTMVAVPTGDQAVAAPGIRLVGPPGADLELAPVGATPEVARRCAMALARFDDPEREDDGAELPATVRLVDLIDLSQPDPEAIARRWADEGARVRTTIGVAEHGPVVFDLVADGPHGLVAGTTGSGKSELLRSLVTGLAAGAGPDDLTFVLVDYKGGSAFDACARLPHTVGLVTDLDDRLAARALVCLEAELRYRERCLRGVGAEDIAAYRLTGGAAPLPRMLVVVDEFAALAKELPEFMDALVDIGARGRSLGLHLLVATQRPAGVVRENLRANTNLRIALRVNDRADSVDVLDDPRAAMIGRSQPGRGYVRFGPSELVPFQAAAVTAPSVTATAPVRVDPFRFAAESPPTTPPAVAASTGDTDLDRLVAAMTEAATIAGVAPPRRPWPDPLPEMLSVDELDRTDRPEEEAVPLGLIDEPDRQRTRTLWWEPAQGPLLVYGMTGSGTTTTLATIAVGLAAAVSPDDLHLYVLDCDGGGLPAHGGLSAPGDLSALEALPHVGAVVGPGERERQMRLVRMLAEEVERRRAVPRTGRNRIVLLVDGYGAFEAAFDGLADTATREALRHIVTSGAPVGVVVAATASRAAAVPSAVASTVGIKLVLRLADPLAATTFGLRRPPVDLPPGRAVQVGTGREIQMAVPHPSGLIAAVDAMADRRPDPAPGSAAERRPVRRPPPVAELPSVVKVDEMTEAVRLHESVAVGDEWVVPVGIGDTTLEPVGFRLGPGDHVLIAGEPHSGRSTFLAAVAVLAGRCLPDVDVVALAPRRSPLREIVGLDTVASDVDDLVTALAEPAAGRRRLVLIDDVDDLDTHPALVALVAGRDPSLHVVAAGRRDLKGRYQHWARELCRSRIGLWLRPTPGVDADLWSTPLPRAVAGLPAGRGYLVADGGVELVQVMMP